MALPFDHPKRDRNPLYLHPRILAVVEQIMNRIHDDTDGDLEAKVLSTHRTPQEQFELFKQGRAFSEQNSSWVKVSGGRTVTNIDGHSKLSRHNYLPALACDFGLFRGNKYLTDSASYDVVGPPARAAGLGWGGDWRSFKDKPHVQLELSDMFKNSFVKDVALQWQRYLKKAGVYTGAMDGIFGDGSRKALKKVVGTEQPTPAAWKALFKQFGALPASD